MPTEYKIAPNEVIGVMDRVIDRHPKFADIRKHDVRIEVLMAWSDNDEPVKAHGAVAFACVKVVNGEERANGGPDVRIKVDAKRYGDLGPKSREALFAHELYHLEVQYRDGGGVKRDVYGRPVIKAIPDDWCINGFKQVAGWYGDSAVELKTYRAVGEVLGQLTLFDGKTPPSVVDGTLAALLSVGHTEAQARAAIDGVLAAATEPFTTVFGLVEAVYEGDWGLKAQAPPEPVTGTAVGDDMGPGFVDSAAEVEARRAANPGVCPVCDDNPGGLCPMCGKPGPGLEAPGDKPKRARKPRGEAEGGRAVGP